jgi:lipoate-protein ligase A
VTGAVADLYDYEALRHLEATMFVVELDRPTLVLGAHQSIDVLDRSRVGDRPVRRRRGGGGLVYLQPGDLWVDWWLPASDARWLSDVHASSILVGHWWSGVLARRVAGEVSVHAGSLEGDPAHRLVCFAGRGPGEVFVDGRKAVGLTQWRVREGIFVSTVVHSTPSNDVISLLSSAPEGLASALDHHVLAGLSGDRDGLIDGLVQSSGPWQLRRRHLSD